MGGAGQVATSPANSTTYGLGSGLTYEILSSTSAAPTLTNPSSYYNKLLLTLDTAGNANDTKYAIAISPDAFVSTTNYVQADGTVGTSQVWQTYAAWGGASGITIIGLTPPLPTRQKRRRWRATLPKPLLAQSHLLQQAIQHSPCH